MLSNLMFSVNVMLPLAIVMVLGYALKRFKLIDHAFITKASKLAFTVAFPCSMFSSFTRYSLFEIFDLRLVLYIVLAITASMLLLLLIVPAIIKDRPTAASMVQGMFRSNMLIQGLPLLANIYGEGNTPEGTLMLPFAILTNNVLATVIFAALIPQPQRSGKQALAGALWKMAVNPLIIASALGIAFSALAWRLPVALDSAVTQVGRMAVPLALLSMGGEFEFRQFIKGLRYSLPTVLVRLLVIPAVITGIAIALNFRGPSLAALFLFTGSSCAAAGYVMAREMGGNETVAAQFVYLSTVLSAFTLTIGIFLLRQLGLI